MSLLNLSINDFKFVKADDSILGKVKRNIEQ